MGIDFTKICSLSQNFQFVQYNIKRSQNLQIRSLNIYQSQVVNQFYKILKLSNLITNFGILFNQCVYYEGQIKNNSAYGNGILRTKAGVTYQGKFKDNLAQGSGQYINQDIIFQGLWFQGKPINGNLQIKAKKIIYQIHSINLQQKNNFQVGEVFLQLKDKFKYKGYIQKLNGFYEFQGKGTMIFQDGSFYQGDWKNGQINGNGKYVWADRIHKYQGNYVNGVKHGQGKYYIKQNFFFQGQWKNGKRQGKFKVIQIYNNQRNVLYQNQFQDDKAKGGGSIIF